MIKQINKIKPLCFINNSIIVAKNNIIYKTDTNFLNFDRIGKLDNNIKYKLIYFNRLLTRITRCNPHCAVPINKEIIYLSANGKLYEINTKKGRIILSDKYRKDMRNPLSLTHIKNIEGFDELVCYGEYFGNSDKDKVNIVGKIIGNNNWKILYTFPSRTIKHIHSIIPDNTRNVVWIFTGDFENSVGIWMAKNNFKNVHSVFRGNQKYRACIGFPIKEGLLYATDSQFEKNYIRILKYNKEFEKWNSENIHSLDGPCIYGCKVGSDYIFSTSVEPGSGRSNKILNLLDKKPGPGIMNNCSQIVIGNLKKGFKTLLKGEKDQWPMGLCQFGVFTFPTGNNPTNKLYAYGIALKNYDGKTSIIEIE